MWKMGVPVATPITLHDVWDAFSAFLRWAPYRLFFEKEVRELLGVGVVRATNSGRSSLFLVLEAMKRTSHRDEVVIPAFVCPSVARAVVKAGLKPVLCDVGPNGSGLDVTSLERALNGKTLAVITAHLFGYPNDIGLALNLSHDAGAWVIEDCAQAFGAKLGRHFVGTAADAAVFSFGMSKVLWSMGGGLIVSSNPALIGFIDKAIGSLHATSAVDDVIDIAKFAIFTVLIRSHHLAPIDAIWGKLIRGKDDCDDFEALLCPPSHALVARRLLARFNEITRIRKQKAIYFASALSGFDGITLPSKDAESDPVFLRFPVIVHDPAVRDMLSTGLRRAGINVSEMYTRESYEALQTFAPGDSYCPRAEYLTERMLNLPTHAYMRKRDLRATVAVFESVLSGRRARAAEDRPALVH